MSFPARNASFIFKVGLSTLLGRARMLSPVKRQLLQRFVPFPAVGVFPARCRKMSTCLYSLLSLFLATASVSNLVFMRNGELSSGIEVFDSNNEVVGTSQLAAKEVIFDFVQGVFLRHAIPVVIVLNGFACRQLSQQQSAE